jgi:hypothetical protein
MIIDVTDLLPTFCELAGATVPLGIDGVSIAPTLTGKGRQRHRQFLIHEAGNGQSIIRGKYKLVRPLTKKSIGALQLYDLVADRAESTNIAARHPKVVKELEALLLGERVAEPKGFANTYHTWQGGDGGKTSDPKNWSDYVYANAGITYQTDDGPPQLSWTARVENKGGRASRAQVDTDLEVLALEVRGAGPNARQTLALGPNVNLTGRNEIRLSAHSTLDVNGGVVSSLRWVEIQPEAALRGKGKVDAVVYNKGELEITGGNRPALRVSGDYLQGADALLSLELAGGKTPPLQVDGRAVLQGELRIGSAKLSQSTDDKPITILAAQQVSGTFSNPGKEVIALDGTRFVIGYSETKVTLTKK